ncbi:MAG: class I SAM-dependent methyltransferase [Devosia sp.]
MTILDFLLRNSGYRKKLQYKHASDPADLIAGGPEDRLAGLETVLASAPGRTVLDVGSHDGTVAEAFAKAGATRIDGCDIFERGVALATERVASIQPNSSFHVADLSLGPKALQALPLLPKYDIVCYLGVHHHVKWQMSPSALERLTAAIVGRSSDLLAVRTPLKYFDGLHRMISAGGFVPVGDLVTGENRGVGPLRVYRRRTSM